MKNHQKRNSFNRGIANPKIFECQLKENEILKEFALYTFDEQNYSSKPPIKQEDFPEFIVQKLKTGLMSKEKFSQIFKALPDNEIKDIICNQLSKQVDPFVTTFEDELMITKFSTEPYQIENMLNIIENINKRTPENSEEYNLFSWIIQENQNGELESRSDNIKNFNKNNENDRDTIDQQDNSFQVYQKINPNLDCENQLFGLQQQQQLFFNRNDDDSSTPQKPHECQNQQSQKTDNNKHVLESDETISVINVNDNNMDNNKSINNKLIDNDNNKLIDNDNNKHNNNINNNNDNYIFDKQNGCIFDLLKISQNKSDCNYIEEKKQNQCDDQFLNEVNLDFWDQDKGLDYYNFNLQQENIFNNLNESQNGALNNSFFDFQINNNEFYLQFPSQNHNINQEEIISQNKKVMTDQIILQQEILDDQKQNKNQIQKVASKDDDNNDQIIQQQELLDDEKQNKKQIEEFELKQLSRVEKIKKFLDSFKGQDCIMTPLKQYRQYISLKVFDSKTLESEIDFFQKIEKFIFKITRIKMKKLPTQNTVKEKYFKFAYYFEMPNKQIFKTESADRDQIKAKLLCLIEIILVFSAVYFKQIDITIKQCMEKLIQIEEKQQEIQKNSLFQNMKYIINEKKKQQKQQNKKKRKKIAQKDVNKIQKLNQQVSEQLQQIQCENKY